MRSSIDSKAILQKLISSLKIEASRFHRETKNSREEQSRINWIQAGLNGVIALAAIVAAYFSYSFKIEDRANFEFQYAPFLSLFYDTSSNTNTISIVNTGSGAAVIKSIKISSGGPPLVSSSPIRFEEEQPKWRAVENELIRKLVHLETLSRSSLRTAIRSRTLSPPMPEKVIPKDYKWVLFSATEAENLGSSFAEEQGYYDWKNEFGGLPTDYDLELCYCSLRNQSCRTIHLGDARLNSSVEACPKYN